MKMIMKINNMVVHLHIGCHGLGDEERTRAAQPIRFDAAIRLGSLPAAFQTLDLADTIGYHDLYDALHGLVTGQHWFLLETLAMESFQLLKGLIPTDAKLELTVTKLKPFMTPLIQDGTSITLTDD
ncbi:MAG: dihydroneopterin aldolase [Alphaproteobacteria bacterium]|nr:dihydroneopterin aldolase [Alphaproteobacteria bacterium]